MTNPLSTINPSSWIGDGTEGAALDVEGSTVSLGSAKRGTPYNIRLDCDFGSEPLSSLYYEIELGDTIEGSIAVGLATASELKPGWKTRGMFYNGNLTNGAAGLRIGFGDRPGAGDTVGVYLLRDGDACRIVYYLNDRCLGVGFAVASSEAFYPCLHIDGRATVKYSAPTSFPSTTNHQPASFNDPYSGKWLLKMASTGPELHELPIPEGGKIVLSFTFVEPKTYRLSIKVANTFNCTVRIVGKVENFDAIELSPAMSTMMMPPPELQPLERFVDDALNTLIKMVVSSNSGGEDLVMTGPKAEMSCKRFVDNKTNSMSLLTTYV